MRRRQYVRCKNYDQHMARMEVLEDGVKWSYGCYVVADMAIHYGWRRVEGRWLCADCVAKQPLLKLNEEQL